jgi:hypothetical protein
VEYETIEQAPDFYETSLVMEQVMHQIHDIEDLFYIEQDLAFYLLDHHKWIAENMH